MARRFQSLIMDTDLEAIVQQYSRFYSDRTEMPQSEEAVGVIMLTGGAWTAHVDGIMDLSFRALTRD